MDVSFLRTADYSDEAMDEAARRHFDALDAWGDLKNDPRVLIKPNLIGSRAPERAATTHPALIRAVARLLRRAGVSRILIADSPGGAYIVQRLRSVYRAAGLYPAPNGAALNENCAWREKAVDAPGISSFHLIEPLFEADYVINLPKLKTHSMMTMSCAAKNLFGCVPGLQKPELHGAHPGEDDFANLLVELARTVAPNLTIVDAVVSMEGNGPTGGTPRPDGVTFASRDVFALDEVAARYAGIDTNAVPTIRAARARGYVEPGAIRVVGDAFTAADRPFLLPDASRARVPSRLPHYLRGPAARLLGAVSRPVPRVSARDCVGCGRCEESCPRGAIAVRDENGRRAARVDARLCIACFCCQEMCPAGAISIRRDLGKRR